MLLKVHHAETTIPRGAEDEARKFYCELLGLREIPKPEALQGRGGFWLELDRTQIHVGVEDGINRNATKAHIAYEVDNIEAWRVRLEERGVKTTEGIPIPGLVRFEFRDPFGNRIEFWPQARP